MRVDEPYSNEAKAGIHLIKKIEPETWAKVVSRVYGANFGAIYTGQPIMTGDHRLPSGHTWKSYTLFLLDTLPSRTAQNYRRLFKKKCLLDSKDTSVWKAMAMAIAKNDFCCKTLSAKTAQKLADKRKAVINKYRNL